MGNSLAEPLLCPRQANANCKSFSVKRIDPTPQKTRWLSLRFAESNIPPQNRSITTKLDRFEHICLLIILENYHYFIDRHLQLSSGEFADFVQYDRFIGSK